MNLEHLDPLHGPKKSDYGTKIAGIICVCDASKVYTKFQSYAFFALTYGLDS